MASVPSHSNRNRNIGIGIAIVVVVAIIAGLSLSGFALTQSHTVTSTVTTTVQSTSQVSDNIVNGLVTVNAGNYEYYPINVPSGATGISVTGSFYASGGSGNDIRVYIFDSTNFVNWENGHSTTALYASGQLTTASISASLPGFGTYYLVYDNTFSIISQKNVNTNVNLQYYTTISVVSSYTTKYVTQ